MFVVLLWRGPNCGCNKAASFRKNVYKPRQCHVYDVLLHEVGSVSTAETQILGGFYEGLCNAQDRRVRLD